MHKFKLRVYYEDTDAMGIVYYANYLKFVERARNEWVRAEGSSLSALAQEGYTFPVMSVNVRYRRPAALDDELLVASTIMERKKASLLFQQTIARVDEPDVILCEVMTQVACIDTKTMKPKAWPTDLQLQ